MNKINIHFYKSPIGDMILGDFEGELCLADWKYRKMRASINSRIQKGLNAEFRGHFTPLHKTVINQFTEYFNKTREEFDIPILMVGTPFQITIWNELRKINYGTTETYLGLSQRYGNEKAIRAVANANGANAISIIIPCHRIIGSDGSLVGYAGGIRAKKRLLELESSDKSVQLELF